MKYIISGSVCLIVLGVLICWFYDPLLTGESHVYFMDVTPQISSIFEKLDNNNDGVLDYKEFLNLPNFYKIFLYRSSEAERKISNYEVQSFPNLSVQLGEQIINIQANFEPLILSSLKKNVAKTPKEELGDLEGLLQWKRPYKPNHPFGVNSFSLFLPKTSVKPGDFWWIIAPELNKYSRPLSNRRYFPPRVEKKFHMLFALLSLFHPQPFLLTRFSPQGTVAVLRAVEKSFYDIIFRVHAEFQLNKPPYHPFWFTPAQFSGQLIINKDATVVKFFHVEVPNRKLNVDMEWFTGPTEESMEVDIGYVPQMALISTAISVASDDKPGADQNVSTIKWDEEVTIDNALKTLELQFFPFKKANYYDMPEAFQLAKTESKLVHGIILWGNLDDQSC